MFMLKVNLARSILWNWVSSKNTSCVICIFLYVGKKNFVYICGIIQSKIDFKIGLKF